MKKTTAMERLDVAVIGCGKMGLQHIRAIERHGGARIVGIADPRGCGEEVRILLPKNVPVFSNAEDLLRSVRPDVIHIVTPPRTHASLGMLALEHGAHIFMEKPFVLHALDAAAIMAMAEERGLKICAGHQLLFEKQALAALRLLPRIGRIVHVESYFSFRPVRRSPDGGGSIAPIDQILDILPHPAYLLLRFLCADQGMGGTDGIDIRAIEAKPGGDLYAILRMRGATGVLVVTLNARPIESHVRVTGTNGSLHVDFISGSIVFLPGPGTSPVSIILNPFRRARQTAAGAASGIATLLASRARKIYPGLSELIGAFYASINERAPDPIPGISIVKTVELCEALGGKLRDADAEAEKAAEEVLERKERSLPPASSNKGILVTGGTGFLGRAVVSELRRSGHRVRVFARRVPSFSMRVPGVEYYAIDLASGLSPDHLKGIDTIVHCAAETAGKKEAHERNSIMATRNLLDAAAGTEIRRLIHVSSVAVHMPGRNTGSLIDERTPLDLDNESRGPYVWGKAESERIVSEWSRASGIDVRIVRLGPLVDFNAFEAPGRLGREVGRRFICMGGRRTRIGVCDVSTAAEVIRYLAGTLDDLPAILNLLEPEAPTRGELVERLCKERTELKPLYVPDLFVRAISPFLTLLQRLVFPGKKPVDIRSAFASEIYDTGLAGKIISMARTADKENAERKAAKS